jgi:hypothetical protein
MAANTFAIVDYKPIIFGRAYRSYAHSVIPLLLRKLLEQDISAKNQKLKG